MKNVAKLIPIILMISSILMPISTSADIGVIVEQYLVDISISDTGLIVEENIKLINNEYENVTTLRFWIQQNADDVKILNIESGEILSSTIIESNIWECNLSMSNFTLSPQESIDIRLTYILPTETKQYVKTFLYDSNSLEIIYEDNELFIGENIREKHSIQILLHNPTEAPVNIIYILIIFILVIILIASTLLLMRKQRTKAKKSIVESDETLATKKALLLSVLKDIEKKHRSKDISDDTYNKLKEEYKQQAVEVMKKIEDKK